MPVTESSSKPIIDVIGDLDTGALVKEDLTIGESCGPTSLMFYYNPHTNVSGAAPSRKRSRDDRPFHLYRVDHHGKLHHVHQYKGEEEWSHFEEEVYAGYSFAVFRGKAMSGDFILNNLVLSYRIRASVGTGQRHAVFLSIPPVARLEDVHSYARIRLHRMEPFPLPISRGWTITQEFRVPSLPSCPEHLSPEEFFTSNSFNVITSLVLDQFSTTDKKRKKPLFPQLAIVPQIMCGRIRYQHEDKTYKAVIKSVMTWIAQAQMVWGGDSDSSPPTIEDEEEEEDGNNDQQSSLLSTRVMCGKAFPVQPGEIVMTTIHYDGFSKLRITVKSDEKKSELVTTCPFPDLPSLCGWKEYFDKKSDVQSQTIVASSDISLEYNNSMESQGISTTVMESMCPLRIRNVMMECEGALSDSKPKTIIDVVKTAWNVETLHFTPTREGVSLVDFERRLM
jgi:hypothetical protein